MENTLKRNPCYLVQRGTFKKDITEFKTRKDLINFHYMGSAEFEFGALPKSTIRMLVNIDFYDIFTVPEYKNQNGEEMKIYVPVMFIEHIKDIVDKLVTKSIHLKECCDLSEYVKGQKSVYSSDFWWDIDNDFYIFFGEEKANMILEAHRNMREESKGHVEIGDWNKLSKYYSSVNQDLSAEALEFLKPKKNKLKSLVKTIHTKMNREKN